VRTAGSMDLITPRVVETIRGLDPNRPIDHVQTLEEIRNETIAPQRLNATLIGLFALLALMIATVGVAGPGPGFSGSQVRRFEPVNP
jgi:hypothetical protein